MKALVTGATGFLGSHLCRRLLRDGHEVTVLRRATSSNDALDKLNLTQIIGDVTDLDAVNRAIAGNDMVFHTAAHLAYWGQQKETQNKVNIAGTQNVVTACRQFGVKKLIHVSSVAAIGIPNNPANPANENFPFNLTADMPVNYHLSKKLAEDVVLKAVNQGLHAVIVNPSSIWGKHGRHYRGAEIVEKVRQSQIVPYFTGGICIVHVDDVIEGIMAATKRGISGQRYILGGANLTLKSIAQRAAKKQHLERRFVPLPNFVTGAAALALESLSLISRRRPKITYTTHYCAGRFHYYDSSKAKNELAYSPRSFEKILDECVSFIEKRESMKN